MKESVAIVWFKRDLRVHDHAPLAQAADLIQSDIKVLPLYIVEPEYWQLPDSAARHWQFINQSLIELNTALSNFGQGLLMESGNAVDVFEKLQQRFTISSLHSHQESGNLWTYQRDKQIAVWCIKNRIKWHEHEAYGVFRRFNDRDKWSSYWEMYMARQKAFAPEVLPPLETGIAPFQLPDLSLEKLEADENQYLQRGGRSEAVALFSSFIGERGRNYSSGMSSPLSAATSCSRLSPHFAFGTLSIREVVQKCRKLLKNKDLSTTWKRSLRSFESRLHWHCHFIQKLETESSFETHNMLQIFNGLREDEFNEAHFTAWSTGTTGYPLIDACMRCLRHTGWINFRMRAMLVSFASYQLWLHWQRPAWHLAQCFTDYEPGIHYCQIQMQSGTTGINAMRIYNPVKQSQDQDPKGIFIKRWLPELSKVTEHYIHEPWTMPLSMQQAKGCILGEDYPEPIVDHVIALREARARFSDFKKLHPDFWEHAKALHNKHGSRRKTAKRQMAKKRKKTQPKVDKNQLSLF